VAQGARLGRLQELDEHPPLFPDALLERQLDRAGDRVDALDRRRELGGHRLCGIARETQEGLGIVELDLAVADLGHAALVGDDLPGECNRVGEQVAFVDRIEELRALELLRGHRIAADDHVDGHVEWHHPRQALRAACAGNQPELDLRQCDLRARRRHPVMAAERQLETPTHAYRMDGGDDRLGGAFDPADDGAEVRFGKRLGRVELADVGATGEGLARAGDDDRRDCRIGLRLAHAFHDAGAQLMAETVDRRIRQRDDRDAVLGGVLGLGHVSL
jgi:hypothetical protein